MSTFAYQYIGLFAGEDPVAWTGGIHYDKDAAVEEMMADVEEHTEPHREDDGTDVDAFINEHMYAITDREQRITSLEWSTFDATYKWVIQSVKVPS